jgi:hypothetical protein
MAIPWEYPNAGQERGPLPTAWGESDARRDAEFVASFREVWLKVVSEYLGDLPCKQWNSLLCGVDVYEGSFSFTPTTDFDLRRQLTGCRLHFRTLEHITQANYDTDEEFEEVISRVEARFVGFIQQGWIAACETLAETFDPAWQLPARIINSPEETPPLLETVLTLR